MRHPALEQLTSEPRHVVAICGGAVSGSEAAAFCAARGIAAIVFEQNTRPYGKIEDGLPRWHDKLRAKEFKAIDANLRTPGVYFVPQTRLGRDLPFATVSKQWGLSATLLASGAWRDRPLPVPGADAYVGNGLAYQNSFVHWFNHYEEPGYDGPHYPISDGAIVVGGGLASIDVAKIVNLELYRKALGDRGIKVDVVQMEHAGITATLDKHGVKPEELGVEGCTLYYRRRVRDMPLAVAPPGASAEQQQRTERVRAKMVGVLSDKFRVRVRDCHVPVAPLIENGHMVGLTFRRTVVKAGKVSEVPGSETDVRARLTVSSIGSVPAPIEGVPTRGELYDFENPKTGALTGLPGVFGLGNALTGKGNIRSSRDNAKGISDLLVRDYLGLLDDRSGAPVGPDRTAARAQAVALADAAARREKLATPKLAAIADALSTRWQASGYDGDYDAWIARHRPAS